MPSFTPPTVSYGAGTGDPLFDRYKVAVGVSVLKVNGRWKSQPFPWLGDLAGGEDGVDYFLGGRTYVVSDAQAAELAADGFTTVDEGGYGVDPYGSGGFGS